MSPAVPGRRRPGAAAREDGRRRVVIESVTPEIDGGRFAIKRTVGEPVVVEADAFTDGHDRLVAMLRYRPDGSATWRETPMQPLVNDRWQAEFTPDAVGPWQYTVTAWVDPFLSWRAELERRVDPTDLQVALQAGAQLVDAAAGRAGRRDARRLGQVAEALRAETDLAGRLEQALGQDLLELMSRHPDRSLSAEYPRLLRVVVDRERGRFSAWYEMFPRSAGSRPGEHGTFRSCEARLPYIAGMGFDVLYLPPIHPIGRARRKGPNNTLGAGPDDPGSPWAVGAAEGGHKAVHPALGTLQDFRWFVGRAREHNLEIALDIAFQCAPDHPYVQDHPQWFRWRPDGSVQYAENPPKKYQDIYPFNFETDDWQALWAELKSVFSFWIEQDVRIFRVDNPHTKPFAFWEWVIGEIKAEHPDVIFLSEAFTRPRVMHRLAKLGFTQSYTYFTWRNTKHELMQYLTELTRTDGRDYFRPNFWPNTPDILNEYLQFGGRPAFMVRLVLAATMGASYGIYGPAFELCEVAPREPGSEEYLHSEKYEIRHWDLARADTLRDFVARVNQIRRENPALQFDGSLAFHPVDNEQLVCFSKHTADLDNVVLVVVNLDPNYTQSGWLELPASTLAITGNMPFQVHDLLSGARYLWHGARNYVELNPATSPAHIFRLRRRIRTERDFDYYM